jgi:hypothetical protein
VYIPFQKLDRGGGHLAVELDWPFDLRLAKLDFETRAEACNWTPRTDPRSPFGQH